MWIRGIAQNDVPQGIYHHLKPHFRMKYSQPPDLEAYSSVKAPEIGMTSMLKMKKPVTLSV